MRWMLGWALAMLVLLTFSFFAKAQEFCSYSNAELKLTISNLIESQASKLLVNLTAFPKSTERQQVQLFSEGEVKPNEILFEFDKPGLISLDVLANVKTSFLISKPSAIEVVPAELKPFSLPSKHINFDPYIKDKARELQQQQAFNTLVSLAEWVRQTMTYNESHQELENASTIMDKKQGVCAHYTILFMALARSLGFPARYVSGIAYSPEKGFEDHAWSEVYLGEWIPFDPTFAQYGWLDPCHVEIQKSLDAGEPAITYSYRGKIEPQELRTETKVRSYGKPFKPEFLLELEPFEKEISLDSYVPVKVKAKNAFNSFFALPLAVKVAPSLLGKQNKVVVLAPNSEAESWFITYLDETQQARCGKGCVVTLEVADWFGNSATSELTFRPKAKKIGLEEAQQIAKTKALIDLYCKAEKDFFYGYEPVKVKCVVENHHIAQQFELEGKRFRLAEGQSKELSLELELNRTGKFIHCLNLSDLKEVIATSCLELELLPTPQVEIKAIEGKRANYGELAQLKLLVEANQAIETRLKLATKSYQEMLTFELEQGQNELNLAIKSWKLDIGTNKINIELEHKDRNSRVYSISEEVSLEVKDVGWLRKLWIKLIHLFDYLL